MGHIPIRGLRAQTDRTERRSVLTHTLEDTKSFKTCQFKHRQESRHHDRTRRRAPILQPEDLEKFHTFPAGKELHHEEHPLSDRHRLPVHRMDRVLAPKIIQHGTEGLDQVEQTDLDLALRFTGGRGAGYPVERREPQVRNAGILSELKAALACDNYVDTLKKIDQELVKVAVSGERFQKCLFENGKDESIKSYIKTLVS